MRGLMRVVPGARFVTAPAVAQGVLDCAGTTPESPMRLKDEISDLRLQFQPMTFYQKFEHISILILSGIIAIVVAFSIWHLALRVLGSILTSGFDPTDYDVFQAVFGMIFTVIIALEFKRSLLVVAERQTSVVQVRAVVLIALLAVVRKLIILDLKTTDAMQLFALAAAILALGLVYWLVRDQDRKQRLMREAAEARAMTQ